jgi:hypothetical protein
MPQYSGATITYNGVTYKLADNLPAEVRNYLTQVILPSLPRGGAG